MHPRIRHRALLIASIVSISAPAWGITTYYDTPQPDPVTGLSTGTSFASTPTLSSANGVAIPSSASAGGFNFEGLFAGAYTATAIAPGWIATVSHIGSSNTFVYNGTTYNVVPNSGVIINPASDGTGIELYRIAGTLPTYASIWSSSDGSVNHQQAVLTGRGYDKGAPIYAATTPGDPNQQGQLEGWAGGANSETLRWGENYVYNYSSNSTSFLAYSFDAPGSGDSTPDEADLITGDSGGGVYLYSPVTQQWKLAGLNEGIVTGPYSTTSNYANPFSANLFNTLGLYTAANKEVTSSTNYASYSTVDPNGGQDYNTVTTTGVIDVSYNLAAAANAISIAEDFTNTSNYTFGGNQLTFNSSNSDTTLGVIAGATTISSSVTFARNFDFTIPAGSSLTFSGAMNFNSGVSLGADGPGLLQVNNVRTAGLNISNGTVRILPSGTAAATSIVNSLAIFSGGRLDLANNDLIVDWSSVNPTSTIRSDLVSSYDKGNWDLPGIGTSAITPGNPLYTLGYADNSLLGDSTFDSQPVTANSVLVKYTYVGDANLDGVVNAADLAMMKSNGTTWMQGDFNYDGVVNADDYALFLLGAGAQSGKIQPTPEPAASLALAAAMLLSLRRRRKPIIY